MKKLGFDTKSVHGDIQLKDMHNAIKFPIYAGVAFSFDTAEDLESVFSFRKPAHAYSRVTNPTVEAFERKINSLEDGRGAVAVASGMAAISNVFINIVQSGENIVAANSLFGNTYSLLKNTLKNFGIDTFFVDVTDLNQIEKAINRQTRAVFLETISNPRMNVPDFASIVEMAHSKGVAVIVDSTVTSPYLFNGKKMGVDVVVHSSTKFISGGATSIGGVIVDLGNCNWSGYPSLRNYAKFGEWAFLSRLRMEVYRDLGACMSPQAAFLHSLGLETLSLRIKKVCENTSEIANFLAKHSKVKKVLYPGLKNTPGFELAKKQFNNQFGGVLAFELGDKNECFQFMNALKIIKRATNIGDNTTLIIHPASTIFQEYTIKEKELLKINDELIRLSVGIENARDLIDDIQQAMEVI